MQWLSSDTATEHTDVLVSICKMQAILSFLLFYQGAKVRKFRWNENKRNDFLLLSVRNYFSFHSFPSERAFVCDGKCRCIRVKVPLFPYERSFLTTCRLQSTTLLTPVDNLADSKSTGLLTPCQQVLSLLWRLSSLRNLYRIWLPEPHWCYATHWR